MLGDKLEKQYYWYNDEYMYFSFNGHHSSKYHLFIQNTKDLTIENSIGATSEYSNAMMQEGTYYLGTSRKQKTFKRKCAAEIEDMRDYKRMMQWLTVGTTGELVFDSDRYWGWTVVLDTVGDSTFVKRGDLIIVEFEITFKTIGTYLAHAVYPATWDSDDANTYIDVIGTNEYCIPPIVQDLDIESPGSVYSTFFVQNINNIKQDIIVEITPDIQSGDITLDLTISHENNNYLIATFSYGANYIEQTFTYDSERSTMHINGQVADENMYCTNLLQPNGILHLNSEEPIELYTEAMSTLTDEDGYNCIYVTLDEESFDELCSRTNYATGEDIPQYYLCLVKRQSNLMSYGDSTFREITTEDVDKESYIAYPLDCQSSSDHMWEYVVDTSNQQIIFKNLSGEDTNLPNVNDNDYQLYIGKYHKINIEVHSTQPLNSVNFLFTVNSYNNI